MKPGIENDLDSFCFQGKSVNDWEIRFVIFQIDWKWVWSEVIHIIFMRLGDVCLIYMVISFASD